MNRTMLSLAVACLAAVASYPLALAHEPSDSVGPHLMTPEVLKQRLKMNGFVVQGPITQQANNYSVRGIVQGRAMELVIDRQTGDMFERVAGRLQRATFGPPAVTKAFVGPKAVSAAAVPLPAEVIVRPLPREALEIVRTPR